MSNTVPNARRSDPVGSLDRIRLRQAKAGLASDLVGPVSDAIGPDRTESLGDVVKRAVLAHYGSVKEAAYGLGQVDPSLMMREFDAGKLSRLDVDTAAKAAVACALFREFGACDPKSVILRELRAARERLDEAMNVLERIA